ncbi:hypothetical protein XA68_13911 [Ophiocordyceps unilateralis]|uniref:Uncharacterized protein n=1 Tax=Ophiocordyceps unilateralis TaxID=268505 RepID=A0A2A9P9U3_OPHUN|nr:hypothetical protein XA68_13911 [Ophiocordyceps unilateralis]
MIPFALSSHTTSSWLYDCDYVTWTKGLPRRGDMDALLSHRYTADPFQVGKRMDWGAYLLNILPRDLLYGNKSTNMGSSGRAKFRNSINDESKDGKQQEELTQLIDWIDARHTALQRICWPKHHTKEILFSYKTTVDGLNNLFVSESSLRYDFSAKFAQRDHKPIDPDQAYCIDQTSPYYSDITRSLSSPFSSCPGHCVGG